MKMRLIGLIAAALLAAGCTRDTPTATVDAPAAAPAETAAPATVETDADAAGRAEADANVPDAVTRPGAAIPPPPEPQMDSGAPVPADSATNAGGGERSAPSIAVGEPNPGAPGVVDASCRTDADCAIKDVGSCCGYRPQCVNTASPTFPDQVKAACAKDGRMGICGFPAISGCTCKAGQCEGTGGDAGGRVQ